MDNNTLDVEINRGADFSNLNEASGYIRKLKSIIFRLKGHIKYLEEETGRAKRAKHKAERNNDPIEAESLHFQNKKLLKEKSALIARNVFLIKQGHELKNQICKLQAEAFKT